MALYRWRLAGSFLLFSFSPRSHRRGISAARERQSPDWLAFPAFSAAALPRWPLTHSEKWCRSAGVSPALFLLFSFSPDLLGAASVAPPCPEATAEGPAPLAPSQREGSPPKGGLQSGSLAVPAFDSLRKMLS